MHEMAMVRKAVDIVIEEAEAAKITEVQSVHLSIGEATDVVEDLVEKLFRWLARGTVAEDAEVVITRIPYTVRCNECNNIFRIDLKNKETWTCGMCTNKNDYVLFTGREFRVDRIDVKPSQPQDVEKTDIKAGDNKDG